MSAQQFQAVDKEALEKSLAALSRVPLEMRSSPNWVGWKLVQKEKQPKPTKEPRQPRSPQYGADSTNPEHWGTLEAAMTAKIQTGLDGVGYAFTGTPHAGVDLDNAFDAGGALHPWAAEIVQTFKDCAFIEVSPSGTGLHLICNGTLLPDAWHKLRPVAKDDPGVIEMYDTGRYFTVTGQPYSDFTGLEIGDGQAALDWLQAKYGKAKDKPQKDARPDPETMGLEDQVLIDRARQAANGAKFDALIRGDLSEHDDDHSAADMALCSILAFWCKGDAVRIDRIFRRSGLMRPKWDERRGPSTYGADTIKKAIEFVGTVGEDEQTCTARPVADDKKKPCQLELAREVIDRIGSENVLHDGRSFWRWNVRGVWERIDDRVVKRTVQDVLATRGKVSRSAVDGVTDIAKTETFSPVLLEPTQPFVNCQNGELHWTGAEWEILPHQKDHLAISQIPVTWNADAECPRFLRFLEEIFAVDEDSQEKRQLLLELIGYSLVPSAEYEKFALLVGNGANGKSVVLQVLQALLGRENCASVSPAQFDNRFQRAHLHGKLANLVSELPEGAVLADAELKAIVSGELITAEHKMQTPFDFRPTCTVWFATNHMPGTRDFSDAIFRRSCVLKFNRTFNEREQDTQLKDKLTQELPGILRAALDAYGRVKRSGAFTLPTGVIEARQEWRLDADQVAAFVDDAVDRVVGEKTDSQAVYLNYRQWAASAGINRLLGRKAFTQRLERLGFEAGKGTGGCRVIWGLRLRDQTSFF